MAWVVWAMCSMTDVLASVSPSTFSCSILGWRLAAVLLPDLRPDCPWTPEREGTRVESFLFCRAAME